jgi:TRAP-type transport system small permease protein
VSDPSLASRSKVPRLERVLGLISALPVALIVALTFVDVFGRYVFSSPVRGSLEIIEFAMALVIFTALPLVTHHRQHVSVGLFDGQRPGMARRLRVTLCDLLSSLALAVLTWRLLVQALEDQASGAASVVLGLPQAPLAFALSALAATATVLMLMLTWRSATAAEISP